MTVGIQFLAWSVWGTCFLVKANSLFISQRYIEWPFANLVAFVHVGCEAVSHIDHCSLCMCVYIYLCKDIYVYRLSNFSTIQMLRWTTKFGKCSVVLMTESCDLWSVMSFTIPLRLMYIVRV